VAAESPFLHTSALPRKNTGSQVRLPEKEKKCKDYIKCAGVIQRRRRGLYHLKPGSGGGVLSVTEGEGLPSLSKMVLVP